jgi:hypothetical protein
MSSLTDSPRELASRARRNLHTGRSAQPDRDDHATRRSHIPPAKFPTSFSATDATTFASDVRTKSAYYSVIARAVAGLPNNTRGARFALYDRAEIALTAELMQDPGISEERVALERLALERAILKIEGDARKKETSKQVQETHRRPFTSFLAFCLRPLSAKFNYRAT